jgi:hypothetical protein
VSLAFQHGKESGGGSSVGLLLAHPKSREHAMQAAHVKRFLAAFAVAATIVTQAGCSGGGSGDPPPRTYSLSGRVTRANGAPAVGVTVANDITGTSAVTDANGDYTFASVRAGNYTLTPSAVGFTFEPASRVVALSASAPGQDFTMRTSRWGVLVWDYDRWQ